MQPPAPNPNRTPWIAAIAAAFSLMAILILLVCSRMAPVTEFSSKAQSVAAICFALAIPLLASFLWLRLNRSPRERSPAGFLLPALPFFGLIAAFVGTASLCFALSQTAGWVFLTGSLTAGITGLLDRW